MKNILIMIGLVFQITAASANMDDDPIMFMGKLDQLERRSDDGETLAWDAQAWFGHDLNKLWLTTEGEREDGTTGSADLQLLYSHAISPYWDLRAGGRRDLRPGPHRDWLAIGFEGLAPYFFDINVTGFIGSHARSALRIEAEYDMLFTQRLILTPNLEVNWYARDDPAREIGSGVSDAEAGLRLRYELRREFAPYIGVNWTRKFGGTATFARDRGDAFNDSQWVIGLRAWF